MKTKKTICTSCAQQCGLLAELEDEQVVRLRGNPDDPGSAGFICKKGAAARELAHHPDRVLTPLKRVGPRGGGEWEEIGWDQALDEIAASIGGLTERHGRETLAYSYGTLHGSDWGLGERFMNIFDSPNTVGQDKVCYGPHAAGELLTYGWGPSMYGLPVAGVTRCEVLWGLRPSASMPLLWGAMVASRKAGAKLIVVDPELTHEARRADLFLRIVPGTDAALALGMINLLIGEELYDREFVARATVGFDELAKRASEYPPEQVEAICGVPAEDMVAAARMLGENRPSMVRGGNGLCQSGGAVQTSRALAALITICGSLGVPGGHDLPGPPTEIVANGEAVACQELSPEQRAKRLGGDTFPMSGTGFGDLSAALMNRWPAARWSSNWIATGQEPALWRAITERDPYPVTALVIQCHNALGSSADAATAEAALLNSNLELLVVHDMFMNKTSSLADYLLPAAHWLEKPFYSSSYGYLGWGGDYVMAKPPVLNARVPSDYDFWRDLGRRFGQADRWPDTAEQFWGTLIEPAGLTFDQVCEAEGPLMGADARSGPPWDLSSAPEFGTPSGKVELRSSVLASWGLDPLPRHEVPAVVAAGSEEFPLVLTTGGRVIDGFHQHIQQMSAYRAKFPDPVATIHPDTAHSRSIADGDWVRIATPVGAVEQIMRFNDQLRPGVIRADRWWYPERADDEEDPFGFHRTNINHCTAGAPLDCDPAMGSWLLRGLPCEVERVDGAEPRAAPPQAVGSSLHGPAAAGR